MISVFNEDDKRRITEGIRDKYVRAAISPEGLFRFATGRAGLEFLGYPPELFESLPSQVVDGYCGVGNPFSLGPVNPGEAVLDVGCGAGIDALWAGVLVGPEGRVEGIDLTPEMIDRAERNRQTARAGHVRFQTASAEELPFQDEIFDVVISNGTLNLVPDKTRALAEVYRVMKPGGRLMIADQVSTLDQEMDKEQMIACWFK